MFEIKCSSKINNDNYLSYRLFNAKNEDLCVFIDFLSRENTVFSDNIFNSKEFKWLSKNNKKLEFPLENNFTGGAGVGEYARFPWIYMSETVGACIQKSILSNESYINALSYVSEALDIEFSKERCLSEDKNANVLKIEHEIAEKVHYLYPFSYEEGDDEIKSIFKDRYGEAKDNNSKLYKYLLLIVSLNKNIPDYSICDVNLYCSYSNCNCYKSLAQHQKQIDMLQDVELSNFLKLFDDDSTTKEEKKDIEKVLREDGLDNFISRLFSFQKCRLSYDDLVVSVSYLFPEFNIIRSEKDDFYFSGYDLENNFTTNYNQILNMNYFKLKRFIRRIKSKFSYTAVLDDYLFNNKLDSCYDFSDINRKNSGIDEMFFVGKMRLNIKHSSIKLTDKEILSSYDRICKKYIESKGVEKLFTVDTIDGYISRLLNSRRNRNLLLAYQEVFIKIFRRFITFHQTLALLIIINFSKIMNGKETDIDEEYTSTGNIDEMEDLISNENILAENINNEDGDISDNETLREDDGVSSDNAEVIESNKKTTKKKRKLRKRKIKH